MTILDCHTGFAKRGHCAFGCGHSVLKGQQALLFEGSEAVGILILMAGIRGRGVVILNEIDFIERM